MLSKNDTSRLHTSYIYNEFDGIGFLWGVKETPDLKSVKVNIKNTETIIDLEDIDYWYLVTITEITEFDRNISALLKDGTKIKNLE